MILDIARAGKRLLTAGKTRFGTARVGRARNRKLSTSSSDALHQRPSTKTGTRDSTPGEISEAERWTSLTKSLPSMVYDLTKHGGPKVTFTGQVLKVEYARDSSLNILLRRTQSGYWTIVEARGENVTPLLRGAATEAFDKLYERYLNDLVVL